MTLKQPPRKLVQRREWVSLSLERQVLLYVLRSLRARATLYQAFYSLGIVNVVNILLHFSFFPAVLACRRVDVRGCRIWESNSCNLCWVPRDMMTWLATWTRQVAILLAGMMEELKFDWEVNLLCTNDCRESSCMSEGWQALSNLTQKKCWQLTLFISFFSSFKHFQINIHLWPPRRMNRKFMRFARFYDDFCSLNIFHIFNQIWWSLSSSSSFSLHSHHSVLLDV